VAWRSGWDTEADARELAAAYARFLIDKLARRGLRPVRAEVPGALCLEAGDVAHCVERRGREVRVVEGFDLEHSTRLLSTAF
jgi:hypothetical protein